MAPDNAGRVLRRDVTMTTAALLLINGTFVAASALPASEPQPDAPDMEEDMPARRAQKGKSPPADTRVPRPDMFDPLPVAGPLGDGSRGLSLSVVSVAAGTSVAEAEDELTISDFPYVKDPGWSSGARGGYAVSGPAELRAADLGNPSFSRGRDPAEVEDRTGGDGADASMDLPPRDATKAPAKDVPTMPAGDKTMTVRLGSDGNDVIQGNGDNDYIFGRDGNDVLTGGTGDDQLLGGRGDDVLLGGPGSDLLVGDKGDDTLAGGLGSDVFVFRSGFGDDVIADFNAYGEHDVIDIAKSDFANFAALSAYLTDTPAGAVLALPDGSTLTLSHVARGSLTASDFYFEG